MMRIAAAFVGLALVAAACGSNGGQPASPASEVRIEGFLFKPDALSITTGQSVVWENRDEILHTATSGAPGAQISLFDGVMAEQGERFMFTFADPGTFEYFCTRHNHMRGTITVIE